MTTVRVTAADLARELANPPREDLVLLDVRHQVGTPSARPRYLEGHLPGAIFVELRDELCGAGGPDVGRNPLPDPERLQRSLRSWGVHDGSRVVVYGDAGTPSAGRAWWVLTWAGLTDVRILDGGLQAWIAAGGKVDTAVPQPAHGSVTVRPGALRDVPVEDVPKFAAAGRLVDARPRGAYEGTAGDPDSGHIPGAVSVPYEQLLDEDGVVDLDRARAAFAAVGVDGSAPVAVTCGGGVAAAFEAAVLHELGIESRLHVGSWSQWVGDPGRPRARGAF